MKKVLCCLAEHFCAKLPSLTTALRSVVFYCIKTEWEMQGNDKYERFLFRRSLFKFTLIFVVNCKSNFRFARFTSGLQKALQD